jgi:cell division protease FtsH
MKCIIFFYNIFTVNALMHSGVKKLQYKSPLNAAHIKPTSISEFYKGIDEHKIDEINVLEDMTKIYYKETIALDQVDPIDKYNPRDPENDDSVYVFKSINTNPLVANKLMEYSEKHNIRSEFISIPPDPIKDVISFAGNAGNFIIMSFIFSFVFRFIISLFTGGLSQGGPPGGMFGPFRSIGQSDERENMIKANISLSSWAGSPEIFEECFEIVRYLKNSTIYDAVGAQIPKGVLLDGPPGTGKTLLAKAIASEADANFISVSASEFIELYVGLGAAKVRNLFRQARENTPAIIFIDEIDSVGRQRGAGINMGNDEREQTLNQLLAEMDGFSPNTGVLVIAATNRKDVLDSALLRPGRFDRQITVPLPDRNSRRKILDVHSGNKNMESDVKLDQIAENTGGFSGADLKNLVNEAAIYAARAGNITIGQRNIEDAIEKLTVGLIKTNDERTQDTKIRVAIHEIGHAILVSHFSKYFELKKVSIQPTYGGAGGYTLFDEKPEIKEGGLYTRDILKSRIIIALGGKAAESVYYSEDDMSAGAISDLKQANSIAQRMISNYGLGKDLEVFYNENMDPQGNPFLGRSMAQGVQYSEKTREKVDAEVLAIVNEAYKDAIRIVKEKESDFAYYKDLLLEKTTLTGIDTELSTGNPVNL